MTGAPRPHPTNDVGDFALVRIERVALADQRVFVQRRTTARAAIRILLC
jgi:hypothetical protein